jgi:nucleoside-diphosphate-sugar epimerase
MRIFVAGASGVIGIRLVPLLVAAGHHVAGMTRSPERAARLQSLGAEPVVCDVYDQPGLRDAVLGFAPDVVVSELTDLPDDRRQLKTFGPANNRIRREGITNLLDAFTASRARHFLVQSVAWPLPDDWGAAVDELERITLAAGGVVLRYGQFYGPGTYFECEPPEPPRIHVDEAAKRIAALLAAESGSVPETGIIPITDE